MFYYLLSLFIAYIVYLFLRIGGPIVVFEQTKLRYKKIKTLTSLVKSHHSDFRKIVWISGKMITKALWVSFTQYMNNSVRQIDKNTFEITYVINGKLYIMIVKPERGPIPILQISNDEENDITVDILPYMGPKYDWHNARFSPKILGHKSLTFELSNGMEKTFEEGEPIEMKEFLN